MEEIVDNLNKLNLQEDNWIRHINLYKELSQLIDYKFGLEILEDKNFNNFLNELVETIKLYDKEILFEHKIHNEKIKNYENYKKTMEKIIKHYKICIELINNNRILSSLEYFIYNSHRLFKYIKKFIENIDDDDE